MQRNTPNADRMPKGDLAVAMTRPHLELVETLRGEKDKGRTHRRLDFLSEEAPRARSGTVKPSAGQQANPPEDGALTFETESPRFTQELYASPSLAMGDLLLRSYTSLGLDPVCARVVIGVLLSGLPQLR